MDLALSADEERFRADLVAWLEKQSIPHGLRDYGSTPTADDLESARAWQRMLHAGGWAALSWPSPYGRGASLVEQAIYTEELAKRRLPRQLNFVTMELAGPIVLAFGTAAQIERLVPPMARGDQLWCQMFSEPEAGSDLAGVRTKAVPSGSGWQVTGQKIWTSGAHYADHGLLLARTNPDVRPHRGLTCFALPMDRPGIEVRPIKQLDGESKFNEVFLTDVRLEPDDVLGDVDGGWRVAISVLGNERRMLGSIAIGLTTTLWQLRDQVEALGRDDSEFRRRWSAIFTRVQLLRWTWFRLLSEASGAEMDSRTSVLKLVSSEIQQQLAALARDALGPSWLTDDDAHGWRQAFLTSFGATIAGGTSEIQRNILAERVLDLPR